MKRKWGLTLLAALLVLLPVSTAFGGKASAASSSRIAVIKQLSGDVQVQKSGGSKQFKAFAKLSLNQGDKLITGSKGSAVLQFANGTSEDDKFTVGENATLTFSKLSDKKGTVTKVSMLKGTAWVDVKSIKSKDDDFKLETPTAIMGVRGTAFFARVNPATGGTSTAVLSGVVRFTSEHVEKTGSGSGESAGGTGSSGSSKTIDLYPTQQITLEPTSGDDLREQTTLVDIEEIVKNASPEVIEAILRSKEKIDEENRQTVEKFKQAGVPAELQQGLDKFIQNTQELLGVIAKQAIDQKKIEERQVKQIEEQEKTSFNLTKDQLSQLDEKEKAKQEKARQLAEEAAKKKAAEEAAKLKELADKINAAALKAIEAAKQAQAEANRLAAEAAKRKAEEELLKKLNEQQKQQYQQDKTNNQGGTSVTPGTNPGNPSSNANLGSLSIAGAALSPSFNAAVADYRASVASDKASVVVGASVQESGATFTINGQSPSGGQRTVSLAYGDNEIAVLVTAPSGATKTYKVTVTRQLLNSVSVVFPGQTGIDIDFNSTNAPAPLSIPSGSSNLTLVVPVTGPELDIAVNGQAVQPEPMFTAALTILANQISWRYNIPLALDSNRIVIRATIDDAVKSYELIANRAMSSETAVQSIEATSADGNTVYEAVAGYDVWTVSVPTETSAIKLKINTINADAKVVLGGNVYASGAQISYLIINTTVPFVVQAADGRTEREYRIAIERGTGGGILIANSASVTTAYQTPYSGVLTSSVGAGVTYEVLGEGGPENGTLDVNEDGSYTYTPDEGFEGMDYFLFRAVRGESASAPAVVTIHVEPYDYETPGLVSWTSTWGDAAVEDWFFDYSYQDEEGVGKDYWLYRDRPVNLRMDFTFDPLLVTDAVLALGEQNVYQAADGALQADLEIEEGMNYVSLQYSAEVSGEIKQFNLNFDVYVGTPEDSEIYAYLSTEGMAEVDLVPAGEQTWTTAVRDGDELLLLKYFNDRTTVEVTANGEEVGLDYYYYIYLNRGWNEIVVRTYYPGGEAEAVVKKIHVWRGSEAPEGYGLTGISGTPVKAEPEASPAPIGFIADESRSNLWKAVVTEDTASIDIKPGLGNGLALTDFYVDDYGAYVPAEETAPGSGRYHVPIDGEYTAAYAIVKPVGGGTPFPYRLEIASGAPMDLGPVLASYTGGASETPAMLLFADAAGAWWARLGTDAEPHGFKLKVGGSPGYQLFVDGERVPDAYQSSAYGYVYAFDPVPGSQVHTLEFRDGYGRIVDYEVNLYYGETTEDLNVGDEATVAYGAGSLLTLHPTAGALSATLPAGTPWVDLDLALGSHGEAALFDEEGQEIAASGGSGPIRLTLPDTDPDNNAILTYDVVVTDSDDTGSSGPARVLYTLYLYMAQDIQYAPADMAWNASASGTGLPAEEAEWMYDRQQRYALVVPEELDTLHVYVTPGYGVANVTLTGMAGPDGNGGYSGSLSVGSNSFVMTVNYVDGQRKVYELTAYRGAPVAPVLNVGDQPFAFHYDPASNGYEVYLADSPGTAALSLGLPPGAEVFEAVSEDAPLDRNADGSYVLNLAGASGAKVLSVSGLYNGVAWSCEIRVYFGSV